MGERHATSSSRIPEDDRLLDHVAAGTESEEQSIRELSGEIAERLLVCKRLHLRLEDRLVRSHRTFLDAQTEQRLAHRRRLRLLSMNDQLFTPTMALPVADAGRVTDAFAVAALGPIAPRLPWLAGLIDALLSPARAIEPAVRDTEEPDVDDEPERQTYADAAIAAAKVIFATALASPRRLSSLLGDARATDDPEVIELVWLGSLWAFAPDTPDDPDVELASSVGELTAGLAADDDGSALVDLDFGGADLFLGSPAALAAVSEPPSQLAPPEPVPLDAYRRRR